MAQSHLAIFSLKLEVHTHILERNQRSKCTYTWRGNRYHSMKTMVKCPGDGVNFGGMDNSCQWSLTCDTLAKAMLDESPQENLEFWLPETYIVFPVMHAEEVPCAFLHFMRTMQLAGIWDIKILQDRLRPPLRPPRPNLTLGGTNLRDDIVETSSSTSGSEEGGWVETMSPVFAMSFGDVSFGFEVLAKFSEIASTPLECCPLWKAREAAELVLRCLVRSMELRLSMPELTTRKS